MEELVCHQHLRLPFLQLGKNTEVGKTASSLKVGRQLPSVVIDKGMDRPVEQGRGALLKGSARSPGAVHFLPSPKNGQMRRGTALTPGAGTLKH